MNKKENFFMKEQTSTAKNLAKLLAEAIIEDELADIQLGVDRDSIASAILFLVDNKDISFEDLAKATIIPIVKRRIKNA